jgi:outer membrane receptor protein involved in Fe transport
MSHRLVRFSRRSAFLAGTAMLLATQGIAYAADNTADSDNAPETVTVTGTRIPRPELDLPNPVQSLNAQDLVHSGTTNLTDYLKRIPALQGSLGDLETSGLNTPATDAGSSLSGLNLLNLRNLGFDRTLVLEDGQRLVGSSTGDTGVDTNTIPITLIDRVDVVTGGSSAVYGADGVTGVVNFVMKHDLEGMDARIQAGAPQDGGGSKYIAAVSIGHNFDGGDGNVTLTYELGVQDHLSYTQRSFTKPGGAIFFVPNPANFDGSNPNLPQNIPTKIGTIPVVAGTGIIDDLNGNQFNGNGTPFNPGTEIIPGGQGEFNLGGDGLPTAAAFAADLAPNQHRHIAQIAAHDDFSRFFHLSGEFRFAHVDTSSASEPSFWEDALVTSDNPFLPTAARNAILANGTLGLGPDGSALGLNSQYPYNMPGFPLVEDVKRDTYRLVVSANGDFPVAHFFDNAKYGVNFVYGQTDINDFVKNDEVADRFAAASDVVMGPNGPTCRSNLNAADVPADLSVLGAPPIYDFVLGFPSSGFGTSFTPGANSGCAPLNLFDPTANNKAGLAFAFPTLHNTGILTQTDLNGFISFDFPQFHDDLGFAGPIAFVLGGEYRKEESASMSPAISLTPGLYFDSGAQPVKGGFDVAEAFSEISIPVLQGLPGADELTFDLAGRISSYSTAGTDETWKLAVVYAPIPDVKFRASDAVAVRAPNVGELFAPQQNLFEGINDPCDPQFINQGTTFRAANCQALENALLGPGVYTAGVTSVQNALTVPTLIGGNPNLGPETARTFTAGVVLQPRFLPGFTATVDYYRVNITNAIEAPTAQNVANQCVDLSSLSNPFCAQITRRATTAGTGQPQGGISQASSTQINVASFFTAGQDFTVAYHSDLDDYLGEDAQAGTLDLHLIGNHLDKIATTPLQGQAPTDDSGTAGSPFWQLDLDMVWSWNRFTLDYNWQWYSGVLNFSRQATLSTPNIVAPNLIHTADQNIHSVSLAYDLNDNLNLYGGVDNLFYQKPSPNNETVGIPASPIGRFFYVGARFKTDDIMDTLGLN